MFKKIFFALCIIPILFLTNGSVLTLASTETSSISSSYESFIYSFDSNGNDNYYEKMHVPDYGYITNILKTSDSYYISSRDANTGYTWIKKYDFNFKQEWSKKVASSTAHSYGVFQLGNGNIASLQLVNGQIDMHIMDTEGNFSTKSVPKIPNTIISISDSKTTKDGGIVAGGSIYSEINNYKKQILLKFDNTGELEWSNTYEEIGFELFDVAEISAVTEDLTGGYTAITYKKQGKDTVRNLIKVSDGGEFISTKTSAINLTHKQKISTTHNGYIIATHDGNIGKINSEGDIIWEKNIKSFVGDSRDFSPIKIQVQNKDNIWVLMREYGGLVVSQLNDNGEFLFTKDFGEGTGYDINDFYVNSDNSVVVIGTNKYKAASKINSKIVKEGLLLSWEKSTFSKYITIYKEDTLLTKTTSDSFLDTEIDHSSVNKYTFVAETESGETSEESFYFTTAVEQFKDTSNLTNSYKNVLQKLRGNGLINGYSDGSFKPDKEVTRAEFTTMLMASLQLGEKNTTVQFADVEENAWYNSILRRAYAHGILGGKKIVDGKVFMNPKDFITREEALIILVRANEHIHGKQNVTEEEVSSLLSSYKDENKIPNWARIGVAKSLKYNITKGISSDRLGVGKYTNRIQTAIFSYRIYFN